MKAHHVVFALGLICLAGSWYSSQYGLPAQHLFLFPLALGVFTVYLGYFMYRQEKLLNYFRDYFTNHVKVQNACAEKCYDKFITESDG